MSDTPSATWPGLALAALPLAVALVVLAVTRLGQVRPLIVSAARMVVQLLLLGVVLKGIIEARNPWVVAAAALVMLLTSAHAVGGRVKGSGWPLKAEAFVAMAVGSLVIIAVATRAALAVEPWFRPEVVVPLLGMLLGNSVQGVALAAERLDGELRSNRDEVELRLALGATTAQAAHPALRAAVRAALTPTINGMAIAGVVAIPGMMTGQILAGADVAFALRYQILIYLGIAATVAFSTLILLRLRLRRYFTPAQQLRPTEPVSA
jgi:putative ABC transport system permease protein